MKDLVHDVVADVRSRSVRDRRGDLRLVHGGHHGIYRQRCKIRVGSAVDDALRERLLARVVGNARMSPVDAHKLGRNLASSTRLAHAKHNLGTLRFKRVDNLLSTSAKLNRYVQFYHLSTANSLGQRLHGLPSWIDFLATKRLKSGNQNLLHFASAPQLNAACPARCSPHAAHRAPIAARRAHRH